MPLNSLMPVLVMPCTLPYVVSTTQKSWLSPLPASPDAGRGEGGSSWAGTFALNAEAAIKQEDCLRKPRRLTAKECLDLGERDFMRSIRLAPAGKMGRLSSRDYS